MGILVIDLSAPPPWRPPEQTAPPGLVPCALCGQPVHRDRSTVHFPSVTDQRPCVGSWPSSPAKKKKKGRAS